MTETTKQDTESAMNFQSPTILVEQPTQMAVTQQDSHINRMVELAITQGVDAGQLQQLLDMKQQYDREEARKAFTAALAAFKEEGLVIKKDKHVHFQTNAGETSFSHASLGNIVEKAVPFLSRHGLSHRWETDQADGQITVTCYLTHKDGHSEHTSMTAMPDDSGKKNPIQQIASTITYLERYTFLAITGLAVKDQLDIDDQPPVSVETISEEQYNTIHAMITDNELDMDIFKNWMQKKYPIAKEIHELPALFYDDVIKKLNDSIKRKKAHDNS